MQKKEILKMSAMIVLGIIIGVLFHVLVSTRVPDPEITEQKVFSLLPSGYKSIELVRAEYESKPITLSDNQIKKLESLLREYHAETTDEIAYADTYYNKAYFVLSFFDNNSVAFYSLALCVGRNDTEKCYAVSNYSNLYYARIINSYDFYKEFMDLLQ